MNLTPQPPLHRNGEGGKHGLLRGKKVVITRAAHQAGELADLLRARGAEPLLYPCIAISPPDDTTALDGALQAAVKGEFDWLILTSANTVRVLAEGVQLFPPLPIAWRGGIRTMLAGLKVAAVGAATAEAAQQLLGVTVSVLPEEFRAEALARALDFTSGARILLPQADIASLQLADALARRGAQVTAVTAYRTVIGQGGVAVPALLARGAVDAITFASPSAVQHFIWRLIDEGGSTQDLGAVLLACLGPTTLHKARECGLSHATMPPVATLEQLVDHIEDIFHAETASPH